MAKDNHRRGQLKRKVKAADKQNKKFAEETERLILQFKNNRLK